ncbi:Coiled-coil domain-containing protein 39 [Podochytrium sp. JEL0797]|nr:Coiled-coil domain-containing protein 39 [Podochytrium sp. JEL0797]
MSTPLASPDREGTPQLSGETPRPRLSKDELFPARKRALVDPTKVGLIPISGTKIYLDRLKGWAELVRRYVLYFESILAEEKRVAANLQGQVKTFATPIILNNEPVFESDETMQKFVKGLIEAQNHRAGDHAANATFIENEMLPNLRDLFKEIVSKSIDADKEWVELDKTLNDNRETYVKLTKALRLSLERQKILLGGDAEGVMNKAKLSNIPKDVPRDPWIANLVLQRFIHTLRDQFPSTLKNLVNQQSRILVFEKVVIQLLKPTLNSYFSRRLSKGAPANDPGIALLRALEALDPDQDWQLFLVRNKTNLVDPDSLEKGLAAEVVARNVKYEGMDHSRCQFVKEGTMLRNIPGILRSKGYKASHYVLTVSGFLHGFAEEKKDTIVEVGSTIDVGHFKLGDAEFSLYLPECIMTLDNGREGKEFTVKSTTGGMFKDKVTIKSNTDDSTVFWHDLITSLAVTPAPITEASPRSSISSELIASPTRPDPKRIDSEMMFENNEEIFDGSTHQLNTSNPTAIQPIQSHDPAEYEDSDDDLHPSVANALRGRPLPADLAALRDSMTGKGAEAGASGMDSWEQFNKAKANGAAALENAWDDIQHKETKLNSLLSLLDDNSSRGDAMKRHLKNVQQELKQTQALHDAKTRQIETEDHFKQLADRESGRLVLEIRRTEKEISDTTDHLNTIQNNIYRGNEKIDSIRGELKMEKEELDEWLRVQAEKEEDNFALLKYTKEDDSRIKELSLAIEKLMQEVNKKKAVLSTEVTETQVAQIELDKTTDSFKRLHIERQDLIQQWENAITTMQKRDDEILELQEKYQMTKEELVEKGKIINEKQAFLDMQLSNNSDTEKRIAICDRTVSKFRMEHSDAVANFSQFQDDVEVLRSTLTKTSTDLSNRKNEVSNLKDNLHDKQHILQTEMANRNAMKEKLTRMMGDTMSMEAKAAELQDILHNEEARNKALDKEVKVLREQQFKRTQELFRLRQEEKNLTAEITGSEATLKNLNSTIHKLDQDALKQQALLYAQEFQIQQLERKVRRAQGDRTDEEKDILMKKIEELNLQLEDLTKKFNLINAQLKKSQEDLRQSKRKMENLQKERDSITESIDELNLYTESAGNQLSVKIKEKEELMVEENILRLELRKLRGFLHARADEVFSLEHRQISLHLALEERTKEIHIHTDMLRVQVKNAEEERHSANSELRDRVGRVEKLRRRYEILMTQFAPEEGEEEHSQAFYVIQASQQREELQREGDELDAKIRKAEKEIKALENTLKLMNDRNEGLYKAELNASDVQHKELLEQQYRTVMERYKAKRQDIQTLQQNLQSLERTSASISSDESSRLQALGIIETKLSTMDKEIREQEAKRDRAYKSAIRAAKLLRQGSGGAGKSEGVESVEELDFRIRECKDLGNLVQTEISRIMDQHPEITMKVMDLYTQVRFF